MCSEYLRRKNDNGENVLDVAKRKGFTDIMRASGMKSYDILKNFQQLYTKKQQKRAAERIQMFYRKVHAAHRYIALMPEKFLQAAKLEKGTFKSRYIPLILLFSQFRLNSNFKFLSLFLR